MIKNSKPATILTELQRNLRQNVESKFSNANLVEGNRALEEWAKNFLNFISVYFPNKLSEIKHKLMSKTVKRELVDTNLPIFMIYENQIGNWLNSYIDGLFDELDKKQKDMPMNDSAIKKNVFVVHGKNSKVTDAMFDFLTAVELKPIEWAYAIQLSGSTMPFIKDVLDIAFANAQAVVVLLTPDEVGSLKKKFQRPGDPPHDIAPTGQARLNVIFEAGMAMATHPDRTILVECGEIRPFSDISGIHVVKMNNTSERRLDLIERLKQARCELNTEGKRRWLTVGDFEP